MNAHTNCSNEAHFSIANVQLTGSNYPKHGFLDLSIEIHQFAIMYQPVTPEALLLLLAECVVLLSQNRTGDGNCSKETEPWR